jgi:hypothetical protein
VLSTAPSFDETFRIRTIVAVVIRVESCGREKPLRGECRVDPGSGRGGAGHFTLKFTANFRDFSNFKIQFQRFFANKEEGA